MNQKRPRGHKDIKPDPARWRVLLVILISLFMSLMAISIINVALPAIQQGLQASQASIQWVLSGYALMFGVVLVSAGRAGDIMGRAGFFLIGVAIFTLASIGAGLAPNSTWLNVARFFQGLGSGILSPQGIGMIQQYFLGNERGRAFGYLGTVVGFSVAFGPVLSGLLIYLGGPDLGWRLTFLVNVPFGAATLILGWRWFPRPLIQKRGTGILVHDPSRLLRALDPIGAILLGLTVLALLFPFVQFRTSAASWLLLPAGLILGLIWVKWEQWYARTGNSPMVDLSIFSISSFANGALLIMIYFLGMTSVWVLIALYVQLGSGKSALEAGLVGLPSALFSAYAANWAGKRITRYGRQIVIGGIILAMTGLTLSMLVAILHAYNFIAIWWLLLTLTFVGLGQGLVISPNQTLTLAEVPLGHAGSSGAIMQTGQRIGSSIGIAVITATTFFALNVSSSWTVAVVVGLGLIVFVVSIALVVAIKDLRKRQRG
ncbi:MAG: MFS transporter [Pusillimonas sp.]|nr:MFS transporter [Pusillimonas sp.]